MNSNEIQNAIQQSQAGKNTRGVFCLRLCVGFLIYLLGGFPTLVFALPQDGQVVSGDATISTTSGSDMVVHQATDKLITNWQSFSIGSGESVEFRQPSVSSVALNNVIGLSPSVILGSLKSNGQVFIANGSGVIFGQGAQVNVGGLLATTLSITNEDFLAGDYSFTQDASRPLSSVINRGLIEASYVGLLAPGVENTGTIVANLGSVAMASGKAASMDFVGDGLINFAITEAVDGDVLDDEGNVIDHRVKNAGLIQADGGRVVLSARDAGNIIQNVVNNEGIIEAHSAVERNGEIFLMGGDSGVVANSGTLDASGKGSGETGGTVHMVGEKVGIFDEGVVDVSGNAGGGTALIGGDVQGGGDVQTASNAYVSEDATINADAVENGDGGKVVVWADETARIYGSISATGGALSGDGGFVETSSKGYLQVTRAADVSAAFGLGGEWLIDPRDISIEAGNGNTNINSSNPFVSTGDSSILGVDLIIAALTGGANVTITTGSDGAQAGNITLNVDLDFDGTGNNTLSFIAHNDIILNNSILDSSAGGDTLNLVFTADSDLSGSGTLVVDAAASVESQGGSMQVTARDVDIQGLLNAGAGNITIALAGVGQIQLGDSAFCPTCAMSITGLELQNITASNLTIENSSDDIYVDSITAANSNNIETVILDAGGNVEMGRDSDEQVAPINSSVFNALTVVADGEIFIRENLETDTGNLTLTADADSSGGVDDWITFRSAPVIVSAGDITLNGSSSSVAGIRTVSFGVLDLTAAGTITFNDDFSGTSFANISADNGIIINADFISNAMDLNGDANGSADGIDQIVFADGITVSSFGNSAKAILRKAEALGSITITAGSGIDFLGDFTANGAVTIDADTTTNVSTGTFSVASGTTFNTNNNTLTINASDVDFQGLVNVGTADMTITMALANGQIALGDSTLCPTCTMNLSGAELQNITASTLTIGSVDERILVDNVTAANSNNIGSIALNSGKHIIFQGNASTFNTLTASATEDIDVRVDVTTDNGDLIMTGDSDLSGGNRFKIFSNSVLVSAGDLTLTHSGSAGTIEVTDTAMMTAGGAITLDSDFTAGLHATLSANDGITVNGDFTAWGNINLDGDANSTGDSVTFASGTTLRSTNRGITLNRFDALGGISVLAANGIDVNGTFSSAGATVFNADSDGNSTGNFNVGASGSVTTNNNTLTINAFDVDLQGTLDAGALGDIILSNASGKIQLGDNTLCPTCTMQISGSELQNITAGTLTVNSADDAILVDNVTAANSNNVGTVILNSAKHIAFQGNASTFNALTASATTDIDVRVSLTTDTGDLTLTGDSDLSGGADRLKIFSGSVLTSAGDIVLTHTGGAGTIDVADAATFLATGSIDINGGMNVGTLAMLTAGGSIDVSGVLDVFGSMTMTSGGTITLDDVFTSGATATFNADNGINVNGDFTVTGNVVLDGDANASVDGNDTITLADGVTVESTSGSVTFNSAASALGVITILAANGIDVNGAFSSAGATEFNADKDGNSTGNFNVGASGSVATNNNTLTINAFDIDLQGTLNAGALGDIVLSNASGKIQLGDNTLCPTCAMQISGSELQNITAGTLTINSADDAVFIDNISAANSNNVGTVILDSAKHIAFQGNASTFNALTASATTDIDVRVSLTTDTGDLTLTGDSDLSGGADRLKIFSGSVLTSAGDIILTHTGGAGTIDVADAATFLATGSIDINGGMNVGTLAVLTAGGSIDVSGVLDVFGSMTMTSGGTITLDDVFTSGATATFNADNGINVNGDFTATGNVVLDGDANASVDGNDTITLADGVTVESTSGSVTFNSAASALGVITILAANGIDVNGAFSSAGATEFNADKDGNSTGNFNVGASGSVATNNNTLTINAFDLDLQGTLNAGALGDIILSNASGKIQLGDNTLCPTCAMQISGAELQNITAGTLTINSSDDAIFVDNVTAANSDNIGTVILSSGKNITFQGNASTFNALTANATSDMDIKIGVTTDTGDLNLSGDTDQSGGADRFKVFGDQMLSSAGDITLIHSGGAETLEFTGSALMTSGGTITLGGNVTSGFNVALNADDGINVNGNLTAWGDINLNGDANSSVDGNDAVTLASGITVESTNRSVAFNSATSALGAITVLAARGLDINDTFTSLGLTTLNANSDANSSGELTVTGSVQTNNNELLISANDVHLTGTLNAGTSDITILVANDGTIGLGNTAGDMTIDGSELQNISASNFTLGSTANGNITVDGISAANSDNIGTVKLSSGGDINFSNNDSVFNALNLNAINDINVNTNLETDTGDFVAIADFEVNNVGDFNLGAGNTVTSANDIDITGENVSLNGNLVAGGTITVNGVLFTGGGITIQAADGILLTDNVFNNGDITIDADSDRNGVGDFEIIAGKIVKSFNNNISITANDFIIDGLIDAGAGTLTLLSSVAGSTIGLGNAAGDIVISGSELQNITAANLIIGGTILSAPALNSGITVDGVTSTDLANIGTVSLGSAGDIDFVGSDSTFNDLALFAEGTIATAGATIIATNLSTASGLGMNISTQVDSLDFNNFISGDVTVSNAGGLGLRGDNSFGSLFLTVGGDITSTGALKINQAINIDATGFDVTLDNNLNFNTGVVSILGKNVSLADFGSIDLGASTITGNLAVNVGGNINNSGALFVAGTTDLISNGSVGISLDNAGNDFTGAVTAAGVNVTLVDINDITLGASNITGALTVSAASGVTIEGVVTTSGVTSIDADSDANSNGNFTITATGSVQTNNNTLTINARDVDLQGTLNAGLGDIVLGVSGLGQIQLGDSTLCPTCPMQISGAELQNITAGSLTINNSNEAIFVDNITAANSDNIGTVILNSAKHLVFQGNASTFNALTANATTDMDVKVGVTTDTGDLILTGDSDLSGGPDRFKIFGDQLLTSAGDLTLIHSGSTGTLDFSGSALLTSGGTITLGGNTTSGFQVILNADDGINVNGDVTAFGDIILNGDANASVDGNDTITLADGITLESTTRTVAFDSATTALGAVTVLATDGIDVNGAFSSNGATIFNADSNASGFGTLDVAGLGSISTNNNTLSITANDLNLIGTLDAGTSDITILVSDGGSIGLGNSVSDMTIDGTELQSITAASLTIGDLSNGDVTVDGITAANSDNVGTVVLNSGGNVEFINNDSTFNALTVNAVADVEIQTDLTTDTGDMIFSADVDSSGGGDRIRFTGSRSLDSAGNVIFNSVSGGIDSNSQLLLKSDASITFNGNYTGLAGNGFSAIFGDITINGDFNSAAAVFSASNIYLNGDFTTGGNAIMQTVGSVGGGEIYVNGNYTAGSAATFNGDVVFADGITVESLSGKVNMIFDATALGAITINAADGIDVNGAFTSSGATTLDADSDSNGTGTFVVSSSGSVNTNNNNLSITADDIDLQGTINVGNSDISILVSDGGTIGVGTFVSDMSISGAELQNITTNGTLTIGDGSSGDVTVRAVSVLDSNSIARVSLNSGGSVTFTGGFSSFNTLSVDQSSTVNVNTVVTTDTGGIDLTSSGDININANLNSAATSTFNAGGSINNGGGTVTATNLTATSVTGMNLSTQVGSLNVFNTGVGDILVNNSGTLTLGSATNLGGSLNVATTGTLTINGNVFVDSDVTLAAQDAGGTEDVLHISGTVTSTNGNIDISADDKVDLENIPLSANNGSVTITGTNGSVALDSIVAGNGLTINSGGDVSQIDAFTINGATNINAAGQYVLLNNALNDFTGAVSATGDRVVVWDVNDLVVGTSTVSGNYILNAGGNVTQTGAVTVAGRSSIFAGQDITLTNAANDFEGISFGGHNVAVVDIDGLQLSGGGESGPMITLDIISVITGNLSVTAGGDVTQLARVEVAGTTDINATGHNVTLDNVDNNFTGAISVAGANVTLVDTNAIDLGASTVTGNLNVTAGGAVTDSGALTINGTTTVNALGQDITLDSSGNNFGGSVGVTGANVTIVGIGGLDLGTSFVSGNLILNAGGITQTGGDLTVAGTSHIVATSGTVFLRNDHNSFGGTISGSSVFHFLIHNEGNIDLGTINAGYNLLAQTYQGLGNVTQSGVLTAGAFATFNGADITIDNMANDFTGTVSARGNNIILADSNGMVLHTISATGDVTLNSGGDIDQVGSAFIDGTTTINAAGHDVSLMFVGNDFKDAVIVTANNVSLVDQNAIDMGASAISGNLTIKADSITDSGDLTVLGDSTFTALDGWILKDIVLDNNNDFVGSVSVTEARNVTLVDINGIDLGTSLVAGNLNVTAGGTVTNSGALTVAGTTDVNATGFNVFLNNIANDFGGAVSVDGAFAALFDVNDLELGASTLTNGASIIANGNLTQSGAFNASGSVSISAQDVTLTNAANDFQGTVFVSGNNVSLTDVNAIEFGSSTINGDFMVTAGGAVTQTITIPPPSPFPIIIIGPPNIGPTSGSVITVAGTTMINAIGQDVTLFNEFNDFVGEVGVNAGNVKLADANSITLKDSTTTGALTVNANDGVTINGTVITGGTTSFNADEDANGSGIFSVTALGNITTNDNNLAITADDIDLAGTLNAGLADVSIRISDNGTIGLGNTAGDLTISGSELQNITAANLDLRGTSPFGSIIFSFVTPTNGDITVDGITAANSQNIGQVKLDTGADINFINDDSVFNSLDLRAVSDINIHTNVETDSGEFYAVADSYANGTGTFNVGATGSVTTNDNLLTIIADDIELAGTLNSGLSDVRIWTSDGGAIGLGNTAGDLTITGAELQNITAANLNLGSASALAYNPYGLIIIGPGIPIGYANGDVTVDGITAANSENIGTVILGSGGNIHFENNDSVFNALNVHAVTDINVNTNLETDTGSFEAIADFELNNIGDFNLASGKTVTSALDIDITAENVNLNGNLNAGGTITINGEIFADEHIFINAVDGIIITEDINNNEAITIDADTNRDGIGDFELVGGVLIKSNDYDISITANDFIIDGIIDAGLGNVTLVSSVGGTIGVGEAWGNIRIDNSELQNIIAGNLIIGDENNSNVYVKNVQAVDVANISELTLNATKWGKSVIFYGPASNLNDLTANASNDVLVYGGLTAKDTIFNAGDDVRLWGGTYSFDSLTAVADDDIIIYGTLNATNADYTAGDDIWLDGYQTYGVLNTNANDDIFIDWELTASTATLVAGDDVSINGTTRFGDLSVNAGDDISVRGDHETTGTASFTAGDDVTMRNNLSFGDLNVNAGDYISIYATLDADNANLSSGGAIWLDGYQSYGTLNATAGDDIVIDWELDATTATLIAGDDVSISGTTRFDNLTVNAGDDISVRGDHETTGIADFRAGDDVTMRNNLSFGDLKVVAGDDISVYATLNATGNADFFAFGDAWFDGYQDYNTLSIGAYGDVTIDWELNAYSATITAGDDVRISGTGQFTHLFATAGDDFSIKGSHEITGNAYFAAFDIVSIGGHNSIGNLRSDSDGEIHVNGNNSFGKLDLRAQGDINVHGTLSVSGEGNLITNDDIHLHGYTTFNKLTAYARDDFDSHGTLSVTNKGDITAEGDVHLHGYSSFGKLVANAGYDIDVHGLLDVDGKATLNAGNDIDVHGTFKVGGKGNLNAGDDIHLHGYNTFNKLTLDAGDDISVKGVLKVANNGNLNAGGNVDLDGYNSFGKLIINAGYDIDTHGLLKVDGKATLNAGNDIDVHGAFKVGGKGSLNAGDDIHLHGYNTFNKLILDAGDDISVKGVLKVTNNGTLNAGGDVDLDGYNSFGKLIINAGYDIDADGLLDVDGKATLNAGNDIDVHGTFKVGGKGNLNAGDDIHLHGYNTFGKLEASAWDDININGVLSVAGNGSLNAGDDISLRGYNTFEKLSVNAVGDINAQGYLAVTDKASVNAGNDIDVHGTFKVGGKGNLNAGDDIHLHGYSSFDKLTANSVDDIDIRGRLTVAGKTSMSAGDDIQMNGSFNSGDWTAVAGDDIRLRGDYDVSTADLKANDEIRIDRSTINSGNFSAEADFDNNDSGAFKLDRNSSITSTNDIELSGYGLDIKGTVSAVGNISLTDKSLGNVYIQGNFSAGSFSINAGGSVFIDGNFNAQPSPLTIQGGSIISSSGSVISSNGLTTLAGVGAIDLVTINAGVTLTGSGTLDLSNTGNITLAVNN